MLVVMMDVANAILWIVYLEHWMLYYGDYLTRPALCIARILYFITR